MERTSGSGTLIATEKTVLCAKLMVTPPRLTPTGKISHAKTRVYTQRYRKEWEEMRDFKGWLTSVPFQPTRAYCAYCKKNLHAHRLSLLKHTCTMKHQRAALAYESQDKKQMTSDLSEAEVELVDEVEAVDNSQVEEGEENEDEYIIEKLDTDEEEEEEVTDSKNIKERSEQTAGEEEERQKIVHDLYAQLQSDDEDSKTVIKKIKLGTEEGCRDTLAEAMAHVHSEYLEEEVEGQENIELEMVVDEPDNPNIQVMSIMPASEIDTKETINELCDNEKVARLENKTERKSTRKSLQEECKGDLGPILDTAYQINTSLPSTHNTINMVPLTPGQRKTITFNTGGKTLTLTGGTFQPGTHYVLNKIKGKLPTLVMTDNKPIVAVNQNNPNKVVQLTKMSHSAVPSQESKKHVLLKPVKSGTLKKLRISTHVIDTTKGLPVGGLQVSLYKLMDGRWTFLNESNTTSNGRCIDLVDNMKLNSSTAGRYKIHFDVDKYFTLRRIETMYPFIEIVFDVKNPIGHYHIPVLLSPFGYTTYRGS